MACHLYNTERCLQLQLFKRPNFGVHFSTCPGVSLSNSFQYLKNWKELERITSKMV